MKMKGHINKELYRDGLRQLRLVGIMGMVVFCLAAILTAVGFYISSPYNYQVMDINGVISYDHIIDEGVTLYQCNWVLFASFPVLVPVLVMMMFNFLNHRNASDFYHSIPDTRGTLYLSYCAAVMTWVLAIIGVSTLLAVSMISLIPGYFVVWSSVPKGLFIIISACVLVMGGMMIAKGLTGTLMSNLAVSLMLLFLPRVFIFATTWILDEMLGFVAWGYSSSFLNPRYNVLSGILFCLFSDVNPLGYWTSGIYTLVLGLIYMAAGYVIFVRRKSESAGHAAITRRLQSVFRLALSLTICLLPTYFIVYNEAHGYSLDDSDVFLIVVFYVVAVLAYFIYELVTTGKLKRFGKLCKGLAVLAGLNVLMFGLIWGVYYSVVKYQPDAEDIDYITIVGDDSEYFQNQLNRMKIEDDTVNEIVAEALKRTIAGNVKGSAAEGMVEAVREYTTYYDKVYYEVAVNRTVYKTVAINCGLKTVYRQIEFTENEWETIADCLSDMPEYRQVFYDLPDVNKSGTTISSSNGWLEQDELLAVYEVMCGEGTEVDFSDWYVGVSDVWGKDYLDIIRIYTEIGSTGKYKTVRLPILDSMTKTIDCYFEQMNGNNVTEEEQDMWEELRYVMENGSDKEGNEAYGCSLYMRFEILNSDRVSTDEMHFSIEAYDDGKSWQRNFWGYLDSEEQYEDAMVMMDKFYGGEYVMESVEGPLLIIDLTGYIDMEDGSMSLDETYCVTITDELRTELEELLGYSLEGALER